VKYVSCPPIEGESASVFPVAPSSSAKTDSLWLASTAAGAFGSTATIVNAVVAPWTGPSTTRVGRAKPPWNE
jgi:hypothetical protein